MLVFLVITSVFALYYGLIGSTVRMLLVGTILFAVFTAALLLHRFLRDKRRIRIIFLILLLLSTVALSVKQLAGGSEIDRLSLRSSYTQRLNSYLGVRYSWGGETRLGIDCSGLARTALVDAMLAQGWYEGNARTIWPVAWRLWWRDTSASGMLNESYGYTRRIGHADELSEPGSIRMDQGMSLQAGDLAVTDGGAHVMIYKGDGRWIEANPDDGRVVENSAAKSSRAYFSMPVTILRWWML